MLSSKYMNAKIGFGLLLMGVIVSGAFWWKQARVPNPTTIEKIGQNTQTERVVPTAVQNTVKAVSVHANGAFIETYLPVGWRKDEASYSTRLESPDFVLEDPSVVENCPTGSEACAINSGEQVLAKGAYFNLAYSPCYGFGTEAAFREHEQKNYAAMPNLVDQKPITIEGRDAVLFHTRNTTNTAHPGTAEAYFITVVVSDKDCQDVNFGFVQSTTVDYPAEFQKLLAGLQFVAGKSAR